MDLKCPNCGHSEFTDFELRIIELLKKGPTTCAALAEILGIHTNTVRVHIHNIRDTIRVHDVSIRLLSGSGYTYRIVDE